MSKMEKLSLVCLFLVFSFTLQYSSTTIATRTTTDGDGKLEQWGYVEVLTKVHLFWWHYRSPNRVQEASWPTILWLQGGPGGSGVALGNFLEIGPLDQNFKARQYTWLQKADLLFVDSPAGTGFSYVEDDTLLATTDEGAAIELLFLLKYLSNKLEFLQQSPLYIFGESYGGKIAVTLGLAILKALHAKELTLKLGGVVLGDSWISPEDFAFSWGPLLKDMSRLDDRGLKESNKLAEKIKQELKKHEYREATLTSSKLQTKILEYSNDVNLYDLLVDRGTKRTRFSLSDFMNYNIKRKLKIIPKYKFWVNRPKKIQDAFDEEFMKPRIDEVDQLLAKGVSVTVYNGQLDLICSTKGAEAWVQKLKWTGLDSYLNMARQPLYLDNDMEITKGFRRKYDNFTFYWILMSGHNVPTYEPRITLQMVAEITKSMSVS